MDLKIFTQKVELFIDMWKNGLISDVEYVANIQVLIESISNSHHGSS